MNKKELQLELESLYLECLYQNSFDETGAWADGVEPFPECEMRIIQIEQLLYGKGLCPGNSTTTRLPWKRAYKKYLEIKNSPLFRTMREEE